MKTQHGKMFLLTALCGLCFSPMPPLSAEPTDSSSEVESLSDAIELAPSNLERTIYLETQLGDGPGSDYAVLLPNDQYTLTRQVVGGDSILFTHDADQEDAQPYQSESGFVFIRTQSDRALHRGAEEIFRSVKAFLEEQSLWGGVFFLDTNFVRSSEALTRCEGTLYRPGTGEGTFFLEKRKPKTDGYHSGNSQAYYLLSYSFEGDRDVAEQQYREVANCIYQVQEGQLIQLKE